MSGWTKKAAATGGGGFLHGIEAVVTNYEFTKTPPFETNAEKDDLFFVLTVTPDGAEEPVTTTIRAGGGTYFVISDDGKVLTSTDADRTPRLWDKSDLMGFLVSLEEQGFPTDERFPDPDETKSIDLRGLIGARLRFAQQEVLGTDGKPLMSKPRRTGKHAGKSFKVTRLVVDAVLDAGDGAAAGQSAADLYQEVDTFVAEMLAANPTGIKKTGIGLAVTRYGAKVKASEDLRTKVLSVLQTPEYQAYAVEAGVLAIDKTGTLTAAA